MTGRLIRKVGLVGARYTRVISPINTLEINFLECPNVVRIVQKL